MNARNSKFDMDNSFVYHPLDRILNGIRLVSIAPGWPSDTLQGHLLHVPLDRAPPYEALSYCWRDSKGVEPEEEVPGLFRSRIIRIIRHSLTRRPPPANPRGTMSIDGKPFRLAPNLEAAIRRLRSSKEELVIWIDAICIDQVNTAERNEQVGKMRLIYQGAERVRVWLGEAYEDSSDGFQFIRELVVLCDSPNRKKEIKDKLRNPESLKPLTAVVSLFKRVYWDRVWVIQEIASAKQLVVHCGPDSISWHEMSTVSPIFKDHNLDLSQVFTERRTAIGVLIYNGPSSLASVNRAAATGEIPKLDFLELLFEHDRKLSTNPKDKIYALVGISTANDDPNFVLD